MFGMGIGELLIIAVVALLVIGPEKLPEAAKSLSKGIRDIRKQTRELQDTLEDDHELGDAIRDLKSAWRGDDGSPPRRKRPAGASPSLPGDRAPDPSEGTPSSAQAAKQAAGTGATAGASIPGAASPQDEPSDQGDSPSSGSGSGSGSSFPEPVIRPPSNAIAREPVGVASASPAPAAEASTEASTAQSPAAEQGVPEKAHG